MAPWVLGVVEPSTKPPRDLAAIAGALDQLSGLEATNQWSARWLYEWLYRWLSNSAEHAGIAAAGRFIEGQDAIKPNADPLSTARWHVVIAGQLGELAREVYTAHDVPLGPLDEVGVRLPDDKPMCPRAL